MAARTRRPSLTIEKAEERIKNALEKAGLYVKVEEWSLYTVETMGETSTLRVRGHQSGLALVRVRGDALGDRNGRLADRVTVTQARTSYGVRAYSRSYPITADGFNLDALVQATIEATRRTLELRRKEAEAKTERRKREAAQYEELGPLRETILELEGYGFDLTFRRNDDGTYDVTMGHDALGLDELADALKKILRNRQ